MLIEQITNICARLISKMAAARSSAARAGPGRGGSILGEPSLHDIDQETRAEPYVPTKTERLDESSLHLSC